MFDEISEVFKWYKTGFSSTKESLVYEHFSRERKGLEETPYFEIMEEHDFKGQSYCQDGHEFIARFNTTSAYKNLSEQDQNQIKQAIKALIDGHGGYVKTRLHYVLFTAKKAY